MPILGKLSGNPTHGGRTPCKQTINVLGKYLKDSSVLPPTRPLSELYGWNPQVPNALFAVLALAAFKLPDAPVGDPTALESMQIWQEWWEDWQASGNNLQQTDNSGASEAAPKPERGTSAAKENPAFENSIASTVGRFARWPALLLLGLIGLSWLFAKRWRKNR